MQETDLRSSEQWGLITLPSSLEKKNPVYKVREI